MDKERPVKEGWGSLHPLTGKVVSVVPEEYASFLEAELRGIDELLKAVIGRSHGGTCLVSEAVLKGARKRIRRLRL